MEDLKLRKEFENILDRLGERENFLSNVKRECPDGIRYARRINMINVQNNFHDALHIAFVWCSTPQKEKHWENIAKRFE